MTALWRLKSAKLKRIGPSYKLQWVYSEAVREVEPWQFPFRKPFPRTRKGTKVLYGKTGEQKSGSVLKGRGEFQRAFVFSVATWWYVEGGQRGGGAYHVPSYHVYSGWDRLGFLRLRLRPCGAARRRRHLISLRRSRVATSLRYSKVYTYACCVSRFRQWNVRRNGLKYTVITFKIAFFMCCTVALKSHDPCFHNTWKQGIMTFVGDGGKCSTRKVFDGETVRRFRVSLGWVLSDNFRVDYFPIHLISLPPRSKPHQAWSSEST